MASGRSKVTQILRTAPTPYSPSTSGDVTSTTKGERTSTITAFDAPRALAVPDE